MIIQAKILKTGKLDSLKVMQSSKLLINMELKFCFYFSVSRWTDIGGMMKKILIAWFFFCSFLFLKTTLGQETNYIDIKGSLYQRIKIYPKWEGTAIYNTRLVVATLKKNLEWSGVFDVKKKKKQANLKFIIAKKNVLEYSSKDNANYEIQDAIEVKVLTQEDKLLLQGSFENSSDPKELENNTIDFVQNIIYKIS